MSLSHCLQIAPALTRLDYSLNRMPCVKRCLTAGGLGGGGEFERGGVGSPVGLFRHTHLLVLQLVLLLELLLLLPVEQQLLLPLLLLLVGHHRRRLLLLRLTRRRPRRVGVRRKQPAVPVVARGVHEAGVGVGLLFSPPRSPLLVGGDKIKRK